MSNTANTIEFKVNADNNKKCQKNTVRLNQFLLNTPTGVQIRYVNEAVVQQVFCWLSLHCSLSFIYFMSSLLFRRI